MLSQYEALRTFVINYGSKTLLPPIRAIRVENLERHTFNNPCQCFFLITLLHLGLYLRKKVKCALFVHGSNVVEVGRLVALGGPHSAFAALAVAEQRPGCRS